MHKGDYVLTCGFVCPRSLFFNLDDAMHMTSQTRLPHFSGAKVYFKKRRGEENSSNNRFLLPSAQFLLSFSRAYLYYAYGAHVPFLCTSTYRTGENGEEPGDEATQRHVSYYTVQFNSCACKNWHVLILLCCLIYKCLSAVYLVTERPGLLKSPAPLASADL